MSKTRAELKTICVRYAKIPDDAVIRAGLDEDLNMAQMDLAGKLVDDALFRLFSISSGSTVNGTQSYALPTDMLRFRFVTLNGVKCRLVRPEEIEALNDNSNFTPSTTEPYVYLLGSSLYFTPTPTSAVTYKIYYIAQPTDMTDSTSNYIGQEYNSLLIDYAIARYAERTADASIDPNYYWAKYENQIFDLNNKYIFQHKLQRS